MTLQPLKMPFWVILAHWAAATWGTLQRSGPLAAGRADSSRIKLNSSEAVAGQRSLFELVALRRYELTPRRLLLFYHDEVAQTSIHLISSPSDTCRAYESCL